MTTAWWRCKSRPELPVAHESQTGPLSPVWSAMTLCMSCIADDHGRIRIAVDVDHAEVGVLSVTGASVGRFVDVLEPVVTDQCRRVLVQGRDEVLVLSWHAAAGFALSGRARARYSESPELLTLDVNEYSPIMSGMLATASRSARFCSTGRYGGPDAVNSLIESRRQRVVLDAEHVDVRRRRLDEIGSISCPSAFTPRMRWFVSYMWMAAVVTEKYRVANAVRNPLGLPTYCWATARPGEPGRQLQILLKGRVEDSPCRGRGADPSRARYR